MPIGSQLKRDIINSCRLIDADKDIWLRDAKSYMDEIGFLVSEGDIISRFNRYDAASRALVQGLPFASSIDDFVRIRSAEQDIVLLSKCLILNCLLKSERESYLGYINRSVTFGHFIDPDKAASSWLGLVVQNSTKRGGLQNLLENVSFINFNYDRCIEKYLYYSIQSLYGVGAQVARQFVERLRMVRPYGQLGPLFTDTIQEGTTFGGGDRGIGGEIQNLF